MEEQKQNPTSSTKKVSLQSRLNHLSFPQPQNIETSVWRYFDLPKFVWLLQQKKLFFSRLDLLGDQYEGSTPRLLAEARTQYLDNVLGTELKSDHFSEISMKLRRTCYVNCWRIGKDESEAMWRLYCPDGNGVAIQTSYKTLCSSIKSRNNVYIGAIRYIDYENEVFSDTGNMLEMPMHKRSSFEYEREIRMVVPFYGLEDGKLGENNPPGITIPWDVTKYVQNIYVSPYAQSYFYDVVVNLVRMLSPKMGESIHWSRMRALPVF